MWNIITLFFALPLLAAEPPIEKLKVPPGFKINVYAYPVAGARSLTLGKEGVVFVGSRGQGDVYALLPDKNNDGRSDGVKKIASDLNEPNGVAYKNGDLYVAEISRILRFPAIDGKLENPPKGEPWGPSFPGETHHGWKFIAFGPDGWLYVPVGAPCNNCLREPDLFAAIHRVSPDGKKRELVAKGVRNTVGFDWHPQTKNLWFTENGRDWLGDNIPPCELNTVTKMGAHYGFPHCHGSVLDKDFGEGHECSAFAPPVLNFAAHSAPLGMRFLRHQTAPLLRGHALVAEHGSWNRSTPIGYLVSRVEFAAGQAKKLEPFLTGFLQGSTAWGRPVDVQELPDGSILISDDKADAVYRLTYQP